MKRQIPLSTTTSTQIDSILKSNDKGKIKIKRIEDNTAAEVEILIHLPPNISPDKTIDALFAFTACETSISPLGASSRTTNLSLSEWVRCCADRQKIPFRFWNKNSLSKNLNSKSSGTLHLLNAFYRKAYLPRYRRARNLGRCDSSHHKGLAPILVIWREVNDDDVIRLTEIRIKRISKFDLDKAQQRIDALEADLAQVKHDLANLTDFAIGYFTHLEKPMEKDVSAKPKFVCLTM